jgi:lipopolysaccharide biosynthesis protein
VTTQGSPFPAGGRRVIFYLFYDVRGVVDDYIPYKLERLRSFAEDIIVVVNGDLTDESRQRLEAVADDVWQRPNEGFDVGGYQAVLHRFGAERLAEYDEVVLMNYTWFGPVRPFEPIFERMNATDADFWGITEHDAVDPHPHGLDEPMPLHLQSHWIAVRKRMFTSDTWRSYWDEMPLITSYDQSILHHESRFTRHFGEAGFRHVAAFPAADYPTTPHAAFDAALQLIHDGCPVLKRRTFFHDPLYLDREAIIGRWIIDAAEQGGYPGGHILQNMAHTAAPKILNTNASMLEILPDVDLGGYDRSRPFRVAATVHIFYEDLTDELLDRLAMLPGPYDLYVTTTDETKAAYIRERIAARADVQVGTSEVRVLPSNRGRDLSAFFIGVRDVVVGGGYDLVVKIHSKKTVQQGAGVGTFFKRQQLDNLLNSPGYAANLFALFQREEHLGIVFPPTVHIGFPTLGGAWFTNKELTQALFDRIGVHIPLDEVSPLGAMGAMWIARPEALKLLTDIEYSYEDYQPETEHGDGSLAHVQERAVAYVAGELGYHTRTVANPEYAAISHTFLEFKLDQLSRPVQGYAIDEARVVREHADTSIRLAQGFRGFVKEWLVRYHPDATQRLIGLRNRLRPRRGRP